MSFAFEDIKTSRALNIGVKLIPFFYSREKKEFLKYS